MNASYTAHVATDLYNAGYSCDGHPFIAEQYYVVIENAAGRRFRHTATFNGTQEVVCPESGGKQFAPLYTPKNDTLISLFEITSVEQQQLRTIISRDESMGRDRKRDEARRRAAGAVDRATYLGAAIEKKVKAVQLRADGLSVRAIAEALGVSVGSVSGYLKTDPVECSKSLRITNGVAS